MSLRGGQRVPSGPFWVTESLYLCQEFLVPRNRLTLVSTSESGVLVEKMRLPGPPKPLLLPTLLTLVIHGSAGPHSLLSVSSASSSPSQLRNVTISGDKEGQGDVDQLPRQQNSGGVLSIPVAGISSLDSDLNSITHQYPAIPVNKSWVQILTFLLQKLIKSSPWSSSKRKLLQ